ncbi:hypothetical protein QZH41_013149, partial [Actinostola sp. cb2023]
MTNTLIVLQGAAEYTHLGCFKDTFFRAMSSNLGNVDSVAKCAERAEKKGYSTFGVQNGRECYSSAAAATKYKVFGVAGNCNRGLGGTWANDVYQFPAPTFKDIGCFKDAWSRAMPYIGRYDTSTAIRTCGDVAKSKGFSTFGVQNGGECYSGDEASTTYNRHGDATNCVGGTGGSFANNVYQLPGISCYSCNGQNSCSKISCSEPFCYTMSVDREIGGQTSQVSVAGCMSNCSTKGKEEGCAGLKKNCQLYCCPYENCNDPNAEN